ncbi:MAG: DNA-binding protein [Deltaproteobacteria bacterium]|nr:DNA-binding protein [Deltaproteobacteria bacterium]
MLSLVKVFLCGCTALLCLTSIGCFPKPNGPRAAVIHYAIRLRPGQDLRREIERFSKAREIKAGWIVGCVGSLTRLNLRLANQPGPTERDGHFEIVSLVGTLSTSGVHLHLSASDERGLTLGGHLLEGNSVYTTAEIIIAESKRLRFSRARDGTTPWPELQIAPAK